MAAEVQGVTAVLVGQAASVAADLAVVVAVILGAVVPPESGKAH